MLCRYTPLLHCHHHTKITKKKLQWKRKLHSSRCCDDDERVFFTVPLSFHQLMKMFYLNFDGNNSQQTPTYIHAHILPSSLCSHCFMHFNEKIFIRLYISHKYVVNIKMRSEMRTHTHTHTQRKMMFSRYFSTFFFYFLNLAYYVNCEHPFI